MKREYDFSKGERGRFFHPEAILHVPVYLEQGVESWCAEKQNPGTLKFSTWSMSYCVKIFLSFRK